MYQAFMLSDYKRRRHIAKAGDLYDIELKPSHIEWGEYRHTNTRDIRDNEGYIPIPKNKAIEYGILNSNGTKNKADVMGINLFKCVSADGYYKGILKAQGSSTAGDIYAKQFSGSGDLQAIGNWYKAVNAKVGDIVRVEWISPTEVVIEILHQ